MPPLTDASPRTEHPITASHPLDTPVRAFMTPGVVMIVEDATLGHVYRALRVHGIHAILVVGRSSGQPLGWVTARGLLSWLERDETLAVARDAISEAAVVVEPGTPAREALEELARAGVSHLLVAHRPDRLPEGVVTEVDVVALMSR